MNTDAIKSKWIDRRVEAHSQWIQLSDEDIDDVEGSLDKLTDLLQQRYGYERDRARHEAEDFFSQYMV